MSQRTKAFDIPTIHESLANDLKAGIITLHEAATELYRAGWTNWIDEERTKELLGPYLAAEQKKEEPKMDVVFVIGCRGENGVDYLRNESGDVQTFPTGLAAIEAGKAHWEQFPRTKRCVIGSAGVCTRCGSPLFKSDLPGYAYQCFTCDEDFYELEQNNMEVQNAVRD